MRYYLARLETDTVGPRTVLRPQGVGTSTGWSIIDLAGSGWCILAHPDELTTGPRLLFLTDDLDAPLPVKEQIRTRLGITSIEAATLRGIVVELLTVHGSDTNPTRWRQLRGRESGGGREVYLGGVRVWQEG